MLTLYIYIYIYIYILEMLNFMRHTLFQSLLKSIFLTVMLLWKIGVILRYLCFQYIKNLLKVVSEYGYSGIF